MTAPEERDRQRRLIGLLFAAPFLAGGASLQVLGGHLGDLALAALLCALAGAGWLAALIVASTGRRKAVGGVALAVAMIAAGTMVAAAGGTASPLALAVLPLAFETYWVGRTRGAALTGGAAVVGALAVAAVAFPALAASPASAAHWIVPLVYAATIWPRLGGFSDEMVAEAAIESAPLEAVLDGVVIRLLKSGDVQDVSPQAQRILNVQPTLLLGSGLFERIHVADRLAYLSALADLRQGAAMRKIALRLRLPAVEGEKPAANHRPFAIEFAGPGDHGDLILAVLRDDAEMAEMREAVVRADERVRGDDLAKSRFLAAVSHELRTPLNSIIGFADMLLHEIFGGFTDPRQKEYAGLIRESGNHLLSVVNSILDVSKIESGAYSIHPEPFRFAEAAETCRSMMGHQAATKAIRLEDRVAPNAGEIRGDRRAIQQILINLVSNALKFTPEGGHVAIGAKRLGSRLMFWVSDNGIGIAGDDLERLGQPFMQVQNDYTRRYDGTGLGLSLVKGLVSLHEGSMSIESAPGEGTTVTVSLPCEGPFGRTRTPGTLVTLPSSAGERKMEAMDEALRKSA